MTKEEDKLWMCPSQFNQNYGDGHWRNIPDNFEEMKKYDLWNCEERCFCDWSAWEFSKCPLYKNKELCYKKYNKDTINDKCTEDFNVRYERAHDKMVG
jgi:hypothetical protein